LDFRFTQFSEVRSWLADKSHRKSQKDPLQNFAKTLNHRNVHCKLNALW
jgi:hypothetical protein